MSTSSMRFAALISIGVCLILAGAVGFWLYTPDLSREDLEARYGVTSQDYVEVNGFHIRFRDMGDPRHPALILLHGFGSSLETWDLWTTVLSHDFRVIAMDWPGFGLSGPDPRGDYRQARGVEALVTLMDHLGVQRASFAGNSMGGKYAFLFAAQYPERTGKLVLISPDGFATPGIAYGTRPDIPFMVRLLPYVLPAVFVKMSLAPAFADPSRLTDALVRRYRDFLRAPGVRQAIIGRMEQDILSDPGPALRRVSAPVLLLWGTQDAMIPVSNAKDYLAALPQARLVELEHCGHVPQEEAPALSLEPVRAFLLDSNF